MDAHGYGADSGPDLTRPVDPLLPEPTHPHAPPVGDADPLSHDRARLFTSKDFQALDPKIQDALSDRINLYYNTPFDIFPYGEQHTKPDRYHVLFTKQVEERFPDDAGMRGEVHRYGRAMFRALLTYMFGKRFIQAVTLAGLVLLASRGPGLLHGVVVGSAMQSIAVVIGMLVLAGVFVGVNALVYTQYRYALENRSYSLSNKIVQYTRTLQNDYTTIRALPDQSETHFTSHGAAWGDRSAFLIRLLMWIAARMEYLEKYIQVAMWRLRRERYWMDWAGGFLTVVVVLAWVAGLALLPAAPGMGGRALQGLAGVLGLLVSWASFFRWRTPVNLVRDKLDPDSWIRHATLDVDDSVGEQIRRDKERLVEYRQLSRR